MEKQKGSEPLPQINLTTKEIQKVSAQITAKLQASLKAAAITLDSISIKMSLVLKYTQQVVFLITGTKADMAGKHYRAYLVFINLDLITTGHKEQDQILKIHKIMVPDLLKNEYTENLSFAPEAISSNQIEVESSKKYSESYNSLVILLLHAL